MNFDHQSDLHVIKMNQQARYLGQRSFSLKVTHTHTGLIAVPGPLKFSVIKMLRIVIKTKSNVSVVKLTCRLETDLFVGVGC